MIKQYLTNSFRHLWRYRLFTALNIFGLAISISACWIIYRIVDYEFSYDNNLPQKENIYRLVSGFVFDENQSYNGGVSKPLYQGMRQSLTGIDYAVPVFGQWVNSVEVNTTSGKPLTIDDQSDIVATDSTYFTMLHYKWLAGDKTTALSAPSTVVLTESRAQQYFPGKKPADILNRTITYYGGRDTVQRRVTGIVADFAKPTEFTAQEFCSLPTKAYGLNEWTNTNGSDKVYLQLKQGVNKERLIKQIDDLSLSKRDEFQKQHDDGVKYKQWYELLPLTQSHFSTYINEYNIRKASKPVLYSLIGVAAFLLILACINYINMSIASIPQRSKEIGVRKTLGSSRQQLIGQFLAETMITTCIAGIFSYLLSVLGFALLKDIIPPGITAFTDVYQLVIFIIALAVLVTILAGLYPAWLITRVKAINIFRNISFRQKSKGFSLQKALIVFQFTIALIFISGALIIGKQLNYALTSDMGFNKDAVILVSVPWKFYGDKNYEGKPFTLLSELKKIPGVQNVAMGNEPMESGYSSSQYEYAANGKEPIKKQVFRKVVDTAYLNLYGLKLIAGRNLLPADTTNEFVINETAVHAFGFKSAQDALGKFIGQTDAKFPVVGVVKDFHMQDFYTAIDPMAFQSEKEDLSTFNIKLTGNAAQWQPTIKAIEKAWYQFYPPESFSYKFYDEIIAQLYEQEQHLATLINLATAISIFISCLGLFGLAVLTAFQRTKEIGIRKVLGASVSGIVQLLSKEYVWLVSIAIIIATPVAWLALNKWLQNFVYRINIEWWMFLIAGFIAVALALITVGFHALKAAMANPVKSLRTE